MDGEPAAVVPDSQLSVPTDMGDGPAVAVFDPVGRGQPEPSVVRAGDDHISDARWISVGQAHFWCGRGVVEPMCAGASVEVGDEVPGWGEHDCIEPSGPVGSPGAERVFGGGGEVADMHATVIQVELSASG